MNHALLASLAAVTLGTNAIMGAGIAHASPESEDVNRITAVMGPEQEYQRGLTVNDVAPILRSVTVEGETILAYCIEYWVRAATPDHEAAVTDWAGFTGDNHFRTDPQVREAIAWILHNSYPAVSLQELGERIDSATLTEAEAIAGTQAAIWFYTDDFASDGKLTVEAAPDDTASMTANSAAHVQSIFDYLTGELNTGLTEQEAQASVTLNDESSVETSGPDVVPEAMDAAGDHILGPVVVNSSSEQVDLRLEATTPAVSPEDVTLFDAQGQVIDLTAPVLADEFWVHIPAETASGAIRLAAESVEYGYTGKLIIPEPAPDRRFQTIVVVDQTTDTASSELAMQWQQPEITESLEDDRPDDEPTIDEIATTEKLSDDDLSLQTTPVNDGPKEEQPTIQPTPVSSASDEAVNVQEQQPVVVEAADVEETGQTDQLSVEELAETGAHQTRNVLVAVATLILGGVLVVVNRLRRRYV